ncbi:hypothetical protein SAMN02949497_3552 [Methylomagnum ishizawai]|uniref:Uncharacterized protein n=1 Tax=Methylomagnum ishizawai TaxID=1760988 RepID=A0A1Y6D0K3_9GAMM|nr:hypothetical protein SAMN02949497_3552 [Methylomagnum ishizawai]
MGSPIDQLFPQETLAALRNAPMPPYKGREPSEIELKRIEQATGLTLPSIRAYAFRAVTLLAVGPANPLDLGAQPPYFASWAFFTPKSRLSSADGRCVGSRKACRDPRPRICSPRTVPSPISLQRDATVLNQSLGVRHG